MVKHVLMIKLKDDCKDKAEELAALFRTMKGNVPQVLAEKARTGIKSNFIQERKPHEKNIESVIIGCLKLHAVLWRHRH